MRYAIIVTILACLLCTFETKAQVYQAMPQAGYGPVKRMLVDSVLTIPIGISALRNITGGRDTAQIRYQKSDSSVYVYTGSTWVKLGTGGGGGGSADSTVFFTVYRADTMRANIYARIVTTDSAVYFTKYRSDTMRTNLYSYIKNVDSATYFTKYRSDTMRANIYAAIPQPDTFFVKYPVRVTNDTIMLAQGFVDSVYASVGGSFVPYTGATADVDLGNFSMNAKSFHVKGTAGNGHIGFKHQSAAPTGSSNESLLYATNGGDIGWQNGNNFRSIFATSENTANRTYSFPDSTGRIALLSNVTPKKDITDSTGNAGYTTLFQSNKLKDSLQTNINLKANRAGPTFTDSLVLTSTVGGISLPNMTQTQMNAIVPRLGTQVYNTTYDAVCTYTNDFGWWSNDQLWMTSNGMMVMEEFITYPNASTGNGYLFQNNLTGGTIGAATPISNRPGILQLSTSTSGTGRAAVISDPNTVSTLIVGGGKLIFESDVQIPTLSSAAQTFMFSTGFSGSGVTTANNAIYFLYDSAGATTGSAAIGRWQVVCSNGSTRTYTTTDSTVTAGRFYRLRFEVNAAGTSVAFYINGTLVKTETNNIPTGNLTPVATILKSNGTTARTALIDYIRIRQKFTTPR